jgi:hypothetical protein
MFTTLLFLVVLPAAFAALPTYVICRYRIHRRRLVTYGVILTGGLSGSALALIFLPIFQTALYWMYIMLVGFVTAALVVADFRRRILR